MGETAPATDGRLPRFGPWRRELRAFLELFALAGIAVAQPTLDLLTNNAGLFVTLRTSAIQAVALAVLIIAVPPAVLWGIEVLVGLVLPRVRRYVHALLAAIVVGVLAVEVLKHNSGLGTLKLLVLAVPIGIIGGFLVLQFDVVRVFLRFLALAPVVFAALFLVASPVTAVVFESGTAPANDVTIKHPKRIVMVVFDEFPVESLLDGTGHIDADLFPNFAALAGSSTWFRNETTVAPYTDEAVPAILTGDYPEGDYQPPVAAEYPDNLFTLFGGSYSMNVHETVTHLCPTGLCPDAAAAGGDSFGELVDTTSSLWREFASPRRPTTTVNVADTHTDPDPLGSGRRFVDSLRPSSEPRLDFAHIMLPHQPWHLRVGPQDDERKLAPLGMYKELVWNDDWSALSGRQRHLLQLQAADQVLGKIVAKLRRIGAFDDSVLVVTADHGVAFTAHRSIRGVANQTYPQIMWTPMFLHRPGQTGPKVDDHPVRSIDVLPTIADVVDASIPWKIDGRSMLRPGPAPDDVKLLEWRLNEVLPPPGSDFLSFPSAPGFAAAMRGNASTATGDPATRLYRIGDHGDLIGRPVAPLVRAGSTGPSGRLVTPRRFQGVTPSGERIPWAWVQGRLDLATRGVSLAVAVNGVVAGVSATSPENEFAKQSDFWSTLDPSAFRPGANTVDVYRIEGDAAHPELVKVRLG